MEQTSRTRFADLLAVSERLISPIPVGTAGGEVGAVAAALETTDGLIFSGVSLHLPCGLGICAEVNAIGQMVTAGQFVVTRVVATAADRILAPCGRCRETLVQVDRRNLDALVQVAAGEVARLRELLPRQWQD